MPVSSRHTASIVVEAGGSAAAIWSRSAAGYGSLIIPNGCSTSVSSSLQRRARSEEHTSELQSRGHLVYRLLLEKNKPDLAADSPTPRRHRSDPCVRSRSAIPS